MKHEQLENYSWIIFFHPYEENNTCGSAEVKYSVFNWQNCTAVISIIEINQKTL